MQGWIGKGQATERASYGKDKPGKGRSAVAVRRQETIWNLLQEMDSKGNPYSPGVTPGVTLLSY